MSPPAAPASPRSRRLRWARLPSGLLAACTALLVLSGACTAYHRALKDGETALAASQFEEAEAHYQGALALDPRSQEAQAGLARVHRAWALELVGRGDVAREAGRLEEAAAAYARAAKLDANNPEAPERLRQTLEARVALGEAARAAGDLKGALAHFESVLARDAQHTGARMGADRVRAVWAREAFARAEAYEKAGKLGNALLEYVRADQERTGATPARERAAAVRERLRDEVAYWVQVAPVDDRASAPELAERLEAGHLAAALPSGVPVRVVTDPPPAAGPGVRLQVTLERVWSQKDVQATQRTKKYVAGTRAVPNPRRGQVETALLTQQRDTQELEAASNEQLRGLLRAGRETAQAQDAVERCREKSREACGRAFDTCAQAAASSKPAVDPKADAKTQQAQQAQAAAAQAQVAQACRAESCGKAACTAEEGALTRRRGEEQAARDGLERTLAELDRMRRQVERARDTVVREPLTLEEPVEAEYVYEVEQHKVRMLATVTTRLEDLAGNAPPTPVTRELAAESQDDTHRSHEKVGILVDPLQLQSQEELKRAVGEKAAALLAELARARFDAYRTRVVQAAQRGTVRAGAEDAVEAAIRALLLTADAPPPELLEPLAAARGVARPLELVREP
jgi:tetratricopeptide (TPR) repeat protein